MRYITICFTHTHTHFSTIKKSTLIDIFSIRHPYIFFHYSILSLNDVPPNPGLSSSDVLTHSLGTLGYNPISTAFHFSSQLASPFNLYLSTIISTASCLTGCKTALPLSLYINTSPLS